MPRAPIPLEALEGLDEAEQRKAEQWWDGLNDSARAEFSLKWDSRNDDTSLIGTRDETGAIVWNPLPLQLRGLLIEGRDADEDWDEDYYEYVLNHPEGVVFLAGRTFHICRAHAVARQTLRSGVVPADFSCPLEDAACPLRRLADAGCGKSVRLIRG